MEHFVPTAWAAFDDADIRIVMVMFADETAGAEARFEIVRPLAENGEPDPEEDYELVTHEDIPCRQGLAAYSVASAGVTLELTPAAQERLQLAQRLWIQLDLEPEETLRLQKAIRRIVGF